MEIINNIIYNLFENKDNNNTTNNNNSTIDSENINTQINDNSSTLTKLCNINLLTEIEKFTKIAILGGIIAYISLTFDKKDIINNTDSIKKVYILDLVSSTLGVIFTLYFFILNVKNYNLELKDCILINSQNLNLITSFALVIIEILRFIDSLKLNNLRLNNFIENNNNNNNNNNN